MTNRRSNLKIASRTAPADLLFRVGDVVRSFETDSRAIYGVITDVNPVEDKVYVSWNTGIQKQHSPTEIGLAPVPEEFRKRMAEMAVVSSLPGRRQAKIMMQFVAADETAVPPKFSGDPETHGIGDPLKGGFSIMQNLADNLHKESIEEAGLVTSKTAMYHSQRGRMYRRTKFENEAKVYLCPRCRCEMNVDAFAKGIKLVLCPECNWKTTSDKIL